MLRASVLSPARRQTDKRTHAAFFASAEDFIHRFSLCQFIDQLVKITDFPHQRFLDVSTRTPQTTPLINVLLGFNSGA